MGRAQTVLPKFLKIPVLILCIGILAHTSHSKAQNHKDIHLPLRIHILKSEAPLLVANISEKEMMQLIEGANKVWAQAGVVWEVESIITEQTKDVKELVTFMKKPGSLTEGRRLLLDVLPSKQLLKRGWDLFLVDQLGPSGGVFLGEIGAIVFPVNPQIGRHPQILAHELGHALGLGHLPVDGKNLMQGKPTSETEKALRNPEKATFLSRDQISTAREQAKSGNPAGL